MFGPIEGQKWFFQISSQESLRRTGLHWTLSAISNFYSLAFEISRSCRSGTASGRQFKDDVNGYCLLLLGFLHILYTFHIILWIYGIKRARKKNLFRHALDAECAIFIAFDFLSIFHGLNMSTRVTKNHGEITWPLDATFNIPYWNKSARFV